MCLPLLVAAWLCICVGVFVCVFQVYFLVYVLLLVTTLHLAGWLLPPYIISPKDL